MKKLFNFIKKSFFFILLYILDPIQTLHNIGADLRIGNLKLIGPVRNNPADILGSQKAGHDDQKYNNRDQDAVVKHHSKSQDQAADIENNGYDPHTLPV